MTREEAKRRAELYSALAEGKIIQFKQENGEWTDLKTDLMCGIAESFRYRIKPEPKYRPFETQEECWNEMHKHPNFGWVKEKASEIIYNISGISKLSIVILEDISSFKEAFDIYQFEDGTPFGINEELL